ncbi:MAG: hypothetical protein HQK49_15755 [Oligoflexia bacterium]|nr:hypothetical protein [Oligoflexia bacterium]
MAQTNFRNLFFFSLTLISSLTCLNAIGSSYKNNDHDSLVIQFLNERNITSCDSKTEIKLGINDFTILKNKSISWDHLQATCPGITITSDEDYYKESIYQKNRLIKRKLQNLLTTQRKVEVDCSDTTKKVENWANTVTKITNKIPSPSIIEDKELMSDLFNLAQETDKNFNYQSLSHTVKHGEIIAYCYTHQTNTVDCKDSLKKLNRKDKEEAIISLLWYMQAKSGKRHVLNSKTWQYERGFVLGGTFTSPSQGLYNYIAEIAPELLDKRVSSHFKGIKNKTEYEIYFGKSSIKPPGHPGSKVLLLGATNDSRTYMKLETKSAVPIKHLLESIEHFGNLLFTAKWKKDKHKHNEKMKQSKEIEKHINLIHKKCKLESYTDAKVEQKNYNEENIKQQCPKLRNMITNYVELFCHDGGGADKNLQNKINRIDFCESVVTFDELTN